MEALTKFVVILSLVAVYGGILSYYWDNWDDKNDNEPPFQVG